MVSRVTALRAVAFAAVAAASVVLAPLSSGYAQDQRAFTQIALTEKHVQSFLAVQKEIAKLGPELDVEGADTDPKLKAKLEGIAKANGFASYEEFDTVASNITLVIAGVDPDTREYTDPKVGIAADIEDIKGDKTLTEDERKELLKELEAALKGTPDVAHPGNIELVKRFAPQIEEALE